MLSITTSRLRWMDFLRGFAIILVVLNHAESQVLGNIGEYPHVLLVLNDAAEPFRMPLLMMLSGFLLAKSLRKPTRSYIFGKLANIGWPYFLWSIALLTLLWATGNLSSDQGVLKEYVRIAYDPSLYLWYLAYLLVFYLIALIARPLGNARSWAIPQALIAAALIDDFEWSRMFFLLAFFLLGDALATRWERVAPFIQNPWFILASWILTATAIIASALGADAYYNPMWALPVASSFVALGSVAIWCTKFHWGSYVSRVGEQSIVFYCTHYVFMIVVYNVAELLGVTNTVTLATILIVGSLACGWGTFILRRLRLVDALFSFPATRKQRTRVSQ